MAGAIAFNVLVALVPLILLVVGIVGYVVSARFGDPTEAVMGLMRDTLPTGGDVDVADFLRGTVNTLVEQRGGFTLFGAIFFVWLSTRLVASLRVALREIFDIAQSRSILYGKVFDVGAVLVGLAFLTLNMGITFGLEASVRYGGGLAGLGDTQVSFMLWAAGHALAFASIWLLFLGAYYYLPARRIPWRTAAVAATFSAVLHEVLKWSFSWYATEVANYGSTLGNLATVAVLFFWIYYGAAVFVLGGEVAQVYTMRKASRVGIVSFEDGV